MGKIGSLLGRRKAAGAADAAAGSAPAAQAGPAVQPASASRSATVVFSPHQDDELLTLGVYALKKLKEGQDVFVVLCTDGSRSSVRGALGNGKPCKKCGALHEFDLSVEDFTAARDREFAESCAALGYLPSRVFFHPARAVDGSLSVEQAEAIISSFLALFPGNASIEVCTVSPFVGPAQHRDHRNLGQGAVNLRRAGLISSLKLFVEPYCTDAFREQNPNLELREIPAGADDAENIERAIAAYSLWRPEEGRFAVGYHSVTSDFDDFTAHPASYCHDWENIG